MDRTDPEYLNAALDHAFEVNAYNEDFMSVSGILADRPPETFAELQAIVEAACDCPAADNSLKFVDLIAASEDPDGIVRQLPSGLVRSLGRYYIAFVLPPETQAPKEQGGQ